MMIVVLTSFESPICVLRRSSGLPLILLCGERFFEIHKRIIGAQNRALTVVG